MTSPQEQRTVHLLMRDDTHQFIATSTSDSDLPKYVVDLLADDTTVLAVARDLLPHLGLDTHIVECLVVEHEPVEGGDGYVAALVELASLDASRPLPEGWRWSPIAGVALTVEPELSSKLHVSLAGDPAPLNRPAWSDPDWYRRVVGWITATLSPIATGIQILPVRLWGIAAVVRVDSDAGRYWFKATCAHFWREPVTSLFLSEQVPNAVAHVVAVHVDEPWMLLEDVGTMTFAHSDVGDLRAIEALVGVQRTFFDRVDDLLAMGCQLRPLSALPSELGATLDLPSTDHFIDVSEHDRRNVIESLTNAVAVLGRHATQNTLVHGDFHPGNVAVVGDRAVIFDWSDAAVTHPLIDIPSWTSWYRDDPERIQAIWDAFRAAWGDGLPAALFEEHRIDMQIAACAYHTVSYARIVATMEPSRRQEHGHGLTEFWAMLTRAVQNRGHRVAL